MGDCVFSGTPQHVYDERPYYLHRLLRRSSVTQFRLHLNAEVTMWNNAGFY